VSLHSRTGVARGFNGAVGAASFRNGSWNEGELDSLLQVYMMLWWWAVFAPPLRGCIFRWSLPQDSVRRWRTPYWS